MVMDQDEIDESLGEAWAMSEASKRRRVAAVAVPARLERDK
jgi:hypothetical protein